MYFSKLLSENQRPQRSLNLSKRNALKCLELRAQEQGVLEKPLTKQLLPAESHPRPQLAASASAELWP